MASKHHIAPITSVDKLTYFNKFVRGTSNYYQSNISFLKTTIQYIFQAHKLNRIRTVISINVFKATSTNSTST